MDDLYLRYFIGGVIVGWVIDIKTIIFIGSISLLLINKPSIGNIYPRDILWIFLDKILRKKIYNIYQEDEINKEIIVEEGEINKEIVVEEDIVEEDIVEEDIVEEDEIKLISLPPQNIKMANGFQLDMNIIDYLFENVK